MNYKGYHIEEEKPGQFYIYGDYQRWMSGDKPIHLTSSLFDAQEWINQHYNRVVDTISEPLETLTFGTANREDKVEEILRPYLIRENANIPLEISTREPIPRGYKVGMGFLHDPYPRFVVNIDSKPIPGEGLNLLGGLPHEIAHYRHYTISPAQFSPEGQDELEEELPAWIDGLQIVSSWNSAIKKNYISQARAALSYYRRQRIREPYIVQKIDKVRKVFGT